VTERQTVLTEPEKSQHTTENSTRPKSRWWVWLLVLAVLAFGAYRIRKGMVAP